MNRKTTIWLGSDNASDCTVDADGYGYDVHREDSMVSVTYAGEGEDLEIFILPGLFPKIRKVMKAIEAQDKEAKGKP